MPPASSPNTRRRLLVAGGLIAAMLAVAGTTGFGTLTKTHLVPFIQSVTDMPSQQAHDTHNAIRKALHVPAYALLAFVLAWASRGAARPCLLALLCSLGVAIVDELIQGVTPGRMASAADVGLDALGALLGLALGAWFVGGHARGHGS